MAIVGGGLTGASCALVFAAAGIDVVLLEADSVGNGTTAGDAGLLREGFAGSFHEMTSEHGLKISRAVWESMRRGTLDFATALRRHRIRCDLESQDVLTFSRPEPDAGRWLKREYQTRHDAGIGGTWLTPTAMKREAALESAGGIRTGGAVIDPYRACTGLLAVAIARGARVHERSLVRRLRASARHVDVLTDGGSVRAEAVVVATGAPIQDLRALRRHLRASHAYGAVTEPLSTALRRHVGRRQAALEDATEPGRVVRWLGGDRVLVHGLRQPEVPARGRERAITQRTGQLMYELSLLYPEISGLRAELSWDGVDYETVDGLPLLGPHRNFPRHLFTFGSSRHGAGLSWVAAKVALRCFQGDATTADLAIGFARIL